MKGKGKSVLPKVKTNLKAGGFWDDVKKKSSDSWVSMKKNLSDLNAKMTS